MNVLQKLPNFEIHFHRSGMTIICSIILFITWSFSFLNAIRISKVPGHYINRKIQYSTARTAVSTCPSKTSLFVLYLWVRLLHVLWTFFYQNKWTWQYNLKVTIYPRTLEIYLSLVLPIDNLLGGIYPLNSKGF